MTLLHALVVRHANAFALHVIVSSIVLLLALAVSYLPRLAARTRFAILAAGMAKFLVPASLFAPLMNRPAATSYTWRRSPLASERPAAMRRTTVELSSYPNGPSTSAAASIADQPELAASEASAASTTT